MATGNIMTMKNKIKFTLELHIEKQELDGKVGLAMKAFVAPTVFLGVQNAAVASVNTLFSSMSSVEVLKFSPDLKLEIEVFEDDVIVTCDKIEFPIEAFKILFMQDLIAGVTTDEGLNVVSLPFSRMGYIAYFCEKDGEVDFSILKSYIQDAIQIASNLESYGKAVSIFDDSLEADREIIESLIGFYSPKSTILKELSDLFMAALLIGMSKDLGHSETVVRIVELLMIFDTINSDGADAQSLVNYTAGLIAKDCSCESCLYNKHQAEIVCVLLNSIDTVSRFSDAISHQAALAVSMIDFYGNSYVDLSKFSNVGVLDN